MFFWGPYNGPGVARKLVSSFVDLEPDGCLAADQLKGACQTPEKRGCRKVNKLLPCWLVSLQKNYIIFAMKECFLLTGAF